MEFCFFRMFSRIFDLRMTSILLSFLILSLGLLIHLILCRMLLSLWNFIFLVRRKGPFQLQVIFLKTMKIR